jgi:putative transcriptional regulator
MIEKKTYRSDAFAAIHETISDYYDAGIIDKRTLRQFDQSCLTPIREFTPTEILGLREREGVSQAVFARYLNVSKDSVSQWERGEKHPAEPALKLLSLVEKKGLNAITRCAIDCRHFSGESIEGSDVYSGFLFFPPLISAKLINSISNNIVKPLYKPLQTL